MSKTALILGHGMQFSKKLENEKELFLDTPYGKPTSRVITGKLDGNEIILFYRHGKDGAIPAFQVNYKANIFVAYELGCSHIIATSLCGSLQEDLDIGEFVVFDQFIDLSTHRELTYSDKLELEKLNHSAFNNPFSEEIRDCLIESAVINGLTVHTKGTVLAVDGPRQSTRAESNIFRKWGADVVNTTTAPEAILAHELGIRYAALSLCTYYESWRTDIRPATRQEKLDIISYNATDMQKMVMTCLKKLTELNPAK